MNRRFLSEEEIEIVKVNQEIIKRMADNSKHIKILYITLITASMSILVKNISTYHNQILLFLLGITIVCFYLDARYLHLEMLFIEHHKAIIRGKIRIERMWLLNYKNYEKHTPFYKAIFNFSLTIYFIMIITILLEYNFKIITSILLH